MSDPAEPRRRSPLTRAAASIALLLVVGLSWWAPLDTLARERLEASLETALVSFAIARTLNGVISVAQGTEVAFQPAGVGVVLTAGEILDPLNDLIERFSWLVLMAASSLGMQIVLSEMFAASWVNIAVTAVLALAVAALWFPLRDRSRRIVLRLAAGIVFVRFLVVFAALGTSLLSQAFLAEREDTAIGFLSRTSEAADAYPTPSPAPGAPPESMLDRFERFFDDQQRTLDIEARIERLRSQTETAIAHLIDLIVVYVLETVLLPVAFLFAALAVTRAFVGALLREIP